MKKFDLVATGGTFDIIHKGHTALLNKAFTISSKVIIGLSSDELVKKMGKKCQNNYSQRHDLLESMIKQSFPNSSYQISKLDNDFGPAMLEGKVQALVASEETSNKGKVLNDLRSEKNLPSIEIIVVPMVLADDGSRISTSRIRNSEIDAEGKSP
jgi:pantetheine-phosphate adenylyltransferase